MSSQAFRSDWFSERRFEFRCLSLHGPHSFEEEVQPQEVAKVVSASKTLSGMVRDMGGSKRVVTDLRRISSDGKFFPTQNPPCITEWREGVFQLGYGGFLVLSFKWIYHIYNIRIILV